MDQYNYYDQDQNYNLAYGPYNVVGQSHSLQQQQQQQPQGLQYMIQHHQFPSAYPPSPPHVPLPISTSPTPPAADPDMYDPMSPPISGSDTSADGLYHHSNSSGANSPSSSRGTSLVHRNHIRYNPTPSPTSSSGRRARSGRSHDSDDEEIMGGAAYAENLANTRKEATRRQRIEAEQRRRDELRDGYAKLKEVLPISNQKSSKVSLLERATTHIVSLEKSNKDLQSRINALEQEVHRLRMLNEKISLSANETPSPGMFDGRPLSPPPDIPVSARGNTDESNPSKDESSAASAY